MTKFFAMAFTVVSMTGLTTLAHAHDVSSAKSADAALHRIEKLVQAQNIGPEFLTHVEGLRMDSLPHDNHNQPAFRATLSLFPGNDQTQRQVEVTLNSDAKPMGFALKDGSDPASAPVWPDKAAINLCQLALHHIYDHAEHDTRMLPYRDRLSSLVIRPETTATGMLVAVVQVSATGEASSLKLTLSTSGEILSVELVSAGI